MRGTDRFEPVLSDNETAAESIRSYIKAKETCPWWHILDIVEGYEELIIEQGNSPQKLIQELINLPHVGDRW